MSITRELWLAIVVVVLVAIAGSVTIHGITTKQYVEEQLYAKNLDNASMLALTLSGLEKDPVSLDLFIMSQFDIGHYASIVLKKADGEIVSAHTHEVVLDENTPRWFAENFSPYVEPGIAQVSQGWGQYGTVYVETDTSFAVASMWRATHRLIFGLSLVGIFSGLIGGWALRFIIRPLDSVVDQAESFQEMQFVQLPEPRTLELKRVVRAMNFLAANSKKIMEEENTRLDLMRYKTQFDDEAGVANRDYFISILKGQLAFRDTEGINCLFFVRFTEGEGFLRTPANIRKRRIRDFVDEINDCLSQHHHLFTDSRIARMQKNEFAILLTETHDAVAISEAVHGSCLSAFSREGDPKVFQSVVKLRPEDSFSDALMRADTMIDEAEMVDMEDPFIEAPLKEFISLVEEKRWEQDLKRAIEECDVETFNFPVLDIDRNLVHYQSWAGVTIDGELRKSGYYTHWARYLGLLPQLELTTVTSLINYINRTGTHSKFAFLCSEQFMLDPEILAQLYFQIGTNEKAAKQLCFEVRESTATRFPDEFKDFCNTLKAKECMIGLKRVGESFSQLLNVQEMGLDYVKIDSAFMADIDFNPANHAFIRGFCSLAHTFGINVYADGVKRADHQDLFIELGIDGVVSHIEVIEHLLDD
ncbi:EAL domain-containing protein [Alteromonas mediterranea]|uniref:Diguanylate cyclase n=4 Tax=Alteromonas mediterranea TaxID=314275 RepID=A0AAC9NQI5_9ALTE|nr:LapD/MoxY N-terminal periplasmic domain-containing protein [Alteromonas mediterranea]APD89103.1 diguanylate cyclase [Alteromonas mediterranea]QDG37656.1 EAL domain-containing protein [Alteromonas mediterranea]